MFVKYGMPKGVTSKEIKEEIAFVFIGKFPKLDRKLAF
jgi:hypothetical protein